MAQKNTTITVSLSKKKPTKPNYQPEGYFYAESVKVGHGDQVQWICHDGDLTIDFRDGSPFESGKAKLEVKKGQATDPETTKSLDDLKKYWVTVVPKTGGPVYDDPDLEVGESPGPPSEPVSTPKRSPSKKKTVQQKRKTSLRLRKR